MKKYGVTGGTTNRSLRLYAEFLVSMITVTSISLLDKQFVIMLPREEAMGHSGVGDGNDNIDDWRKEGIEYGNPKSASSLISASVSGPPQGTVTDRDSPIERENNIRRYYCNKLPAHHDRPHLQASSQRCLPTHFSMMRSNVVILPLSVTRLRLQRCLSYSMGGDHRIQ